MIKRRFYKIEHGDRDDPSESSSSSDDSEVEAEDTDDSEEDADEDDAQVRQKEESGSPSSGYESEDSSAHEINLDSSGLPTSDEDVETQQGGLNLGEDHSSGQGNTDSVDIQVNSVVNEDEKDGYDVPECVVKCKSVFKCKLCPRIVCLSRETLDAHLKSKRHARSEKLLSEGRLKVMLDENGKLEDGKLEEETAPTLASPENSDDEPTKKKGQRGQRGRKTRFKKNRGEPRPNRGKKRHKNDG